MRISRSLLVFTKGAPDLLLGRCSYELVGEQTRPLTTDRRAAMVEANEELASETLRSIGVAYGSVLAHMLPADEVDERIEQDLVFAGLIGMMDPARTEAGEAVTRAKMAGIRPS
jgi:Ca2+-transporting ATPase